MSVKVVDKSTGEVIELEYASFEEFGERWDELTQRIAALERAKKKMTEELKQLMGEDDKLPLNNGWHFRKYSQVRRSYPVPVVMELLEDDATKFLKVDKTKLDAELKEHADDGGRWVEISHKLRDSMEIDQVIESLRLVKEKA
jgi:hypothetical protein